MPEDFKSETSNPELEKQVGALLSIVIKREAKWLKFMGFIVSVSAVVAAIFEALNYFRG